MFIFQWLNIWQREYIKSWFFDNHQWNYDCKGFFRELDSAKLKWVNAYNESARGGENKGIFFEGYWGDDKLKVKCENDTGLDFFEQSAIRVAVCVTLIEWIWK